MATSFPFAQQFELNLSEQPTGDSDIIDDLTIIGSVHSVNISDDLTIIGDVSSSGSVTLAGVIEGNLHCTSLIVTPNGRVNGDIVANQEVTVQGKVTGTIRARHVMLRSTAKVEGDIFYHGVGIELGACYDGRLRRTHPLCRRLRLRTPTSAVRPPHMLRLMRPACVRASQVIRAGQDLF